MTGAAETERQSIEVDEPRQLPTDTVGLLEGICTTRAIRRYRNEPVPASALHDMLFAATRAPSGSNRQPFRFLVLTDGPKAKAAKALIAEAARRAWGTKRSTDRYDEGSGAERDSPKAAMARTMQSYVDHLDEAPVLILGCLVRHRAPYSVEGSSIFWPVRTFCSPLEPSATAAS